MSAIVTCDGCGQQDHRPAGRPCPESWFFLVSEDAKDHTVYIVWACSEACRDAQWKRGPGPLGLIEDSAESQAAVYEARSVPSEADPRPQQRVLFGVRSAAKRYAADSALMGGKDIPAVADRMLRAAAVELAIWVLRAAPPVSGRSVSWAITILETYVAGARP